jgi:hypothetical protein
MARILIIDDDEHVRGATKFLLDAHGFEVVAVADGKSGIEAIKARSFDLIVVDLFMAGMNGLETMKAIRENNPRIPIIAVSGFLFKGYCPDMPNSKTWRWKLALPPRCTSRSVLPNSFGRSIVRSDRPRKALSHVSK